MSSTVQFGVQNSEFCGVQVELEEFKTNQPSSSKPFTTVVTRWAKHMSLKEARMRNEESISYHTMIP